MKKVIVTTTINGITEAVDKFQNNSEWELVVIADKKTPKSYELKRGILVTPEMQEEYDKELSDAIGWNCIQRRNFGFLWAKDMGADIVAVVDDDNIPYEQWGKDLMIGREFEVNHYETELDAFDPVGATNTPHLWHRGYPLQLLSKRDYTKMNKKRLSFDIQADFWDGDPDIDAFCRMEYAPNVKYESSFFPLASNKMSPFNSQNTFLSGSVLKDYFLFPSIGRMDDIWASYYVQAKGYRVVYGEASVFQARNLHDLTKDMKAEFLGYEHNLEIVKALNQNSDNIKRFLPENSYRAFELYKRHFE